MGTRSLICIWYKGRFVVAQYCRWDGYLEGQGERILRFLLVPGNIERLKKGLTRITPVDDQTVHNILNEHGYSTFKNNKKVCKCGSALAFDESPKCFPSTLNRDTGAKVLEIIAAARPDDYIPIHLQLEFAADGLFCEYCYCVDLDAEVFEVFGGATAIPTSTGNEKIEQIGKNRFAETCKATVTEPMAPKSMPSLLKSWPLAELPKNLDDMLDQVAAEKDDESEDEDGGGYEFYDDLEEDVDGSGKSEAENNATKAVKDVDDKKPGDDHKPADDGIDKKPQEQTAKEPDNDDKETADEDKPAVTIGKIYETVVDEAKMKAQLDREYEKRIEAIAEDLVIEAAQESIRRERERAAMQQAGTTGDKGRTSTLGIRETK